MFFKVLGFEQPLKFEVLGPLYGHYMVLQIGSTRTELQTCRPAHFGAPILSGIKYHLGGVWNLELGTLNLEHVCRVCRV